MLYLMNWARNTVPPNDPLPLPHLGSPTTSFVHTFEPLLEVDFVRLLLRLLPAAYTSLPSVRFKSDNESETCKSLSPPGDVMRIKDAKLLSHRPRLT